MKRVEQSELELKDVVSMPIQVGIHVVLILLALGLEVVAACFLDPWAHNEQVTFGVWIAGSHDSLLLLCGKIDKGLELHEDGHLLEAYSKEFALFRAVFLQESAERCLRQLGQACVEILEEEQGE